MSSVIRNRNNVKSEELMQEEQIVFRQKRSTADERFNISLLIEKRTDHRHDLFNKFIDFKRTFERVWQ